MCREAGRSSQPLDKPGVSVSKAIYFCKFFLGEGEGARDGMREKGDCSILEGRGLCFFAFSVFLFAIAGDNQVLSHLSSEDCFYDVMRGVALINC